MIELTRFCLTGEISANILESLSLTRDQRKVESILLKKRWELINKDQCEKRHIKIRGNSLFVSGAKHGSVHKFEYIVNTNASNDHGIGQMLKVSVIPKIIGIYYQIRVSVLEHV